MSEVLNFVISDLQKVDHGHRVKFLQWRDSMAYFKNQQKTRTHFCASSHHFTDIDILNIDHQEGG